MGGYHRVLGIAVCAAAAALAGATPPASAARPEAAGQPSGTWTKLSPAPGAPVSPRLGYEGACAWDPVRQLMVRYGGHNQGGGGEQGSEVWTFDPATLTWSLKEPNTSPPGVCCNAQNVFDPAAGRYLRFPSFSGSHGWQWWREIYLNDSSVWAYELAANRWRNMRPLPAPRLAPLRAASWDSHAGVALVFGGEGGPRETVTYDPRRNEWRWLAPAGQPEPRSGGQMAYDPERRVHVLFGSQFGDDPHTWLYDMERNQWRDARPASQPPTDQNDAVLAWDPGRRAVLAVVKRTSGEGEAAQHRLETWIYRTADNTWERANPPAEPDPSGNRARQLVAAPEIGAVLLENCPSEPREQQVWLWRSGPNRSQTDLSPEPIAVPAPPAPPPLVLDVVASVVSTSRVDLRWSTPAGETAPHGYHIERAAVEVLSEDQLLRLKRRTPPLDEPSAGAIRRIGAFQPIARTPAGATTFTDDSLDLTTPAAAVGEPVFEKRFDEDDLDPGGLPYRYAVFAYRMRAIGASGNAGGPSPVAFTVPSAPQWVFSREADQSCQLRWAANPESGLQGYRIYRLDGRWDTDPVTRLTPEPLPTTSFQDPGAGQATRRYHILAIDALGQEGLPSAPVWFEREWKRFYLPFTGDWHQ
jgi:hypothetical protein